MFLAFVWAASHLGFPPGAQDILTELNSPEGDCPICLLPLAGAASGAEPVSAAVDQPVKLPCYHCLHRHDTLRCRNEIRVAALAHHVPRNAVCLSDHTFYCSNAV